MEALASLAGRTGLTDATLYRVVAANFRLGTAAAAQATAAIAGRSTLVIASSVSAERTSA